MNNGLTALENELLTMSADLWNLFVALPEGHPSDITDMAYHIHAIQNMIFARPAIRNEGHSIVPSDVSKGK